MQDYFKDSTKSTAGQIRAKRYAQTAVAAKPIYKQYKFLVASSFLILGLIFVTFAHADENLYEKNYKPQNTSNLASMEANPETKMYVSNHKDEDNISMLESGYDMMGSSGFDAEDVSPDLALQLGKKIKADTVLIYRKYGSAKTANSKIEMIKEAAKRGKELTEKDVAPEPTEYKYYASYWAKLPQPILGVHIVKLVRAADPRDEESKREELAGLKVLAVIKGSPADTAGITKADSITKIGDIKLNKVDDLFAAVKRYQGQAVKIELDREGDKSTVTAQLNKR